MKLGPLDSLGNRKSIKVMEKLWKSYDWSCDWRYDLGTKNTLQTLFQWNPPHDGHRNLNASRVKGKLQNGRLKKTRALDVQLEVYTAVIAPHLVKSAAIVLRSKELTHNMLRLTLLLIQMHLPTNQHDLPSIIIHTYTYHFVCNIENCKTCTLFIIMCMALC